MKKLITSIFFICIIVGCATLNTIPNKAFDINNIKKNGYGFKRKTVNPNTPYIHIKGFKEYKIDKIAYKNGESTSYLNMLKFNNVFSSLYSHKVMYDKFGVWSKEINKDKERVLIWEDVKLFTTSDKLFYIVTGGKESKEEIYCSVYVFDNDNKDCLEKPSVIRDSIVSFFANGIINLSSNKEFYDIYHRKRKR